MKKKVSILSAAAVVALFSLNVAAASCTTSCTSVLWGLYESCTTTCTTDSAPEQP